MAEEAREGQAPHTAPVRVRITFAVKTFLLLLVAVVPSMVLFAVPHTLASLYDTYVPLYIILVAGAIASGVFFALGLFEALHIRRLRVLLSWLEESQRTGFRRVPPLSSEAPDELSEIGRLVSLSAVRFLGESEHNKDLVEQRSLFLRVAAHQLRTPLTGLLWSIDELLSPTISEEEKAKLLSTVNASLRRMSLVINHILASTQVEQGRFGYSFEQTDIAPVVQKLATDFAPIAASRGVTLTADVGGTMPVYADAERIELVLFDLVSNAIDYTPSGGTVTIVMRPEGEKLLLAVEDTGIGILESELPNLFTKFYRADRARKMRPDGTGLGLYLARNIINRHGSEITVQSKEGAGSRFSFYLTTKKEDILS